MSDSKEIKCLQLRLPKDLWKFTKSMAIKRETSFNTIVIELLDAYREKKMKKLTKRDTVVSWLNRD